MATSRGIKTSDMPRLRSNIEVITKSFVSYHFLIYACQNSSLTISKHWKNWKNVQLIEQGEHQDKYRTIRLAFGRNTLIETV
jgi:hypothetical protein